MAGKRKYTDAQEAAAMRDYELFGPTYVEEHHGIPKQTVNTWAKKYGVSTVRNAVTREATFARELDLKLMRKIILEGLYVDAYKVQSRMHDPSYVYGIGGKDNSFEGMELDRTLPIDEKTRMATVVQALTAAVKLEAVDSSSGVEEARSAIIDMARYFGIKGAGDVEETDEGSPETD